MTPDEIVTLAEGFIAHLSKPYVWDKDNVLRKRDNSDTQWANDRVGDLTYGLHSVELWDFILEVLRRTEDMDVLAVLAAGPLEQYLADGGEAVISQIEAQARADKRVQASPGWGLEERHERRNMATPLCLPQRCLVVAYSGGRWSWRLTIVGGSRELRALDRSLLGGPSTSPLGDRNETSDARTPIPGFELRQRLRIPVNPQNGVP